MEVDVQAVDITDVWRGDAHHARAVLGEGFGDDGRSDDTGEV
jgi:hypothetical protein